MNGLVTRRKISQEELNTLLKGKLGKIFLIRLMKGLFFFSSMMSESSLKISENIPTLSLCLISHCL